MTALKQLQLRPYWAFSAISDDQLRASGNNFTGARMLLASLVIWTHCYWRSTGLTGADEVSTMVGLPLSHLAVNGFFFVSGFLICQSLFRQPGFGSFSLMRVARIWPALIVCTVLTVGVFALLSDRPMAYVSAEQSLRFAAMNLTMIKAAYELPAVASGNVNLAIVNGSLWTIPWELRCYLAIGLGFAIAAPRRRAWVEPVLAFSVAAAIIWAVAQQYWSDFPPTYQGLLFNLDIWMRLWGCFAAGALIWLWRQAAMPSPWLATALAAVAIAEYNLVGSALLATPAVIAWLEKFPG